MERPKFEDYLPKGTTVKEIQKMFRANKYLYSYIQALDTYIDYESNRLETMPKIAEFKKLFDEALESVVFQVPYDGTNKFYDDNTLKIGEKIWEYIVSNFSE